MADLLPAWQLEHATVELISSHSFNRIYEVRRGGERFALRVGHTLRIHAPEVEPVEATWLDALAADDFRVAQVVRTVDGACAVELPAPEPDSPAMTATLFTWVDGIAMSTRRTPERLEAAGRLLAELHTHAAQSNALAELDVPTSLHATRVVYFGTEDLVAGRVTPHGTVFDDAALRVQATIDRLWQSGERPHLLHGDFGPHNVLVDNNALAPIDFQDLQFGFAVQDLALSIADLAASTPELVDDFLHGYKSLRPLPDLSPEVRATFAAARSLNIMNLALLAPDSGIGTLLERCEQRVISWMAG